MGLYRTRRTIKINAPADIMKDLRFKFPNVNDSDLIRMTFNTSLLKAEIKLERSDFKNKLGKVLYGNLWEKTNKKKR